MFNPVLGGGYLWQNFRLFSSLLLQVLFYFRQRKIIPQKSDKAFFLFFRVERKKESNSYLLDNSVGKKKNINMP